MTRARATATALPRRPHFSRLAALGLLVAMPLLLKPLECRADGEPAAAKPAAPTPAAVTEASQRYDRGLKLYSEGEYRLAVIEFERAYQLVPDHRVLYNIGQVRVQLGDYAKARVALERYLKDGAGQIPAARDQSVKNDLEMLSGRTATLKIECDVVGAEVFIDGESVGLTPLPDPILMNSGEHSVEVRKADYQPRVLRRTLAGKDDGELKVELDKVPTVAAPIAVVAPPVRQAPQRSTAPIWAAWVTTGALTTGAVVSGVIGLNSASDLDALKKQKGVPSSELHSTESRANTAFLVNDVLTAAAVVAGGISIYLTLKSPSAADEGRDATSIGVRFTANGVALSGRY